MASVDFMMGRGDASLECDTSSVLSGGLCVIIGVSLMILNVSLAVCDDELVFMTGGDEERCVF